MCQITKKVLSKNGYARVYMITLSKMYSRQSNKPTRYCKTDKSPHIRYLSVIFRPSRKISTGLRKGSSQNPSPKTRRHCIDVVNIHCGEERLGGSKKTYPLPVQRTPCESASGADLSSEIQTTNESKSPELIRREWTYRFDGDRVTSHNEKNSNESRVYDPTRVYDQRRYMHAYVF